MKHILNEIDISSHLKSRGVDIDKTRVVVDEKDGVAYFFLYNLSGKIVGYQRYNPSGVKSISGNKRQTKVDLSLLRYKTFRNKDEIVVYGIESYDIKSKYLFVVEGIFDCIKIQNAGYPAIAVLSNNPSNDIKSWIKTLPQEIIVIADKDDAGSKLKKIGHRNFVAPAGYKDLGEMPQYVVNSFLKQIIKR